MLLLAVTGSGASTLDVISRSDDGVRLVRSLAESSDVSISPPPETVTLLVTLAIFAPAVTVSVITGKSLPDAIAAVLVQVSVNGPMPAPTGSQVQPDPLSEVAVNPAGRFSVTVVVPVVIAGPSLCTVIV